MRLRILGILALFLTLAAFPAWALDLQEARGAGLVGEKLDGYVAALSDTPEVAALVRDINIKRQQEYMRISHENGQPVELVGQLAAEQIINNLAPGSRYQMPDGAWHTVK